MNFIGHELNLQNVWMGGHVDLLVNLEGKITGTVVSIYLVFGYQAVMLCMAM